MTTFAQHARIVLQTRNDAIRIRDFVAAKSEHIRSAGFLLLLSAAISGFGVPDCRRRPRHKADQRRKSLSVKPAICRPF
ncbi:MAG: hypothetical protein WBB98_21895 [Xanthobacteraceae bacterium]